LNKAKAEPEPQFTAVMCELKFHRDVQLPARW